MKKGNNFQLLLKFWHISKLTELSIDPTLFKHWYFLPSTKILNIPKTNQFILLTKKMIKS